MLTVIIPSYNRPQLLQQSLEALKFQTSKDFTIIIVDDKSEKILEIEKVIERYKPYLQVHLIKKPVKTGVQESRNIGLKTAKTEYVSLIDDDDYYKPNAIKSFSNFIKKDNSHDLIYAEATVIDSQNNSIGVIGDYKVNNHKSEILKKCYIPSPTVLMKREFVLNLGGFDKSFPSCQDWDTWIRVIHSEGKVGKIEDNISYYRKHNGPTIGKSIKSQLGYKKIYRKHFKKYLMYCLANFKVIYLAKVIKNLL